MNYFFLIFWNVEPTVEWYWQGKTEELGEKPVPVPLCPPQIPLGANPGRHVERPATNHLSHGTDLQLKASHYDQVLSTEHSKKIYNENCGRIHEELKQSQIHEELKQT
jgi:hypothetical protein